MYVRTNVRTYVRTDVRTMSYIRTRPDDGLDGQTDIRQADGEMNRYMVGTHRLMARLIDGTQMNRWETDGQAYHEMDPRMDGRTDGNTGGW